MTHSELFRAVASLEGIISDDFRNELLAFIEGHQEEAKQPIESLDSDHRKVIDAAIKSDAAKDYWYKQFQAAKQPAPEDSTIPYLKSEHDLQIIKMKSLGINTESQLFEQMVNGLILLAAKAQDSNELLTALEVIRAIKPTNCAYRAAFNQAQHIADNAINFYNKEHENSKH